MRDLKHAQPHLVVSISGHGFGHLAQTAPVLNRLHQLLPRMRLTVRSGLPLAHLRSRIHVPFAHLGSEGDLGMAMSSALDVLAAESRAAFARFHAGWERRVADEARLLRELGADMVFANVGYLPLAAAQHAGIANAALCSLNWFDIYRHYCGDDDIAARMFASYAQADAFLRATPGMAMATLPNLVPVAPVADSGANRRDELDRHLGLSREERLVLVSLGGIASRLPLEGWPRIDGVSWLVQESWQVRHPDAIVLESLPLPFSDLLASCDALLCKPGYGSFVEAACSAVPVVYVNRADWPESPALIAWLQQHGTCREVSRTMLERGDLAGALHAVWRAPRREPIIPRGNDDVANWLAHHLPGDS
ncbi:hypothetical protein [Ferrigenium sp. UT5]|uniref:hypothetical protein n=1 Tax=Ferrigenium sp. UT5 TaxID=3242105 RepID=UPI0038B33E42